MENRRYAVSIIKGSRSEGRLEGIEEGIKQGIEEGIKQGIEQGKQQEKVNIARTFKQKGIDIETIAEATGLTRTDIEEL